MQNSEKLINSTFFASDKFSNRLHVNYWETTIISEELNVSFYPK